MAKSFSGGCTEMLALRSAIIDDTIKPAIEWIEGRAVQKVMPTALHALMTGLFWDALHRWSRVFNPGRGLVGNEWRYIVPANSYETDSVVPDVSYLANYADLSEDESRYPKVPPDIVVEVRSPGDSDHAVARKREFYLSWGVKLVIIADPEKRTVETQETNEALSRLGERDTLTSRAFPTLEIRLGEMFAEIDELGRL